MKKTYLIIGALVIVALVLVGTDVGANLLAMFNQTEPTDVDVTSSPANESDDTASSEGEENPVQLVSSVQQEDGELEAKLKATGDVFYCGECETVETCDFVPLEDKKEYLVQGDTIRTGADGTATLKFSDEVDLVLSSNTQIRILSYQIAQDGSTQIYIEQIVGEVYFNVKYSKQESPLFDFRIITPTALIQQTDQLGKQTFSGVSLVEFDQWAGLTPEELETAIDDTFSVACGAFCFEDGCSNCLAFADLAPVSLEVDDITGELAFDYVDNTDHQQVSTIAGETFNLVIDGFSDSELFELLCQVLDTLLNDGVPSTSDISEISSGITNFYTSILETSNCGDKVCDVYDGENKETCPQDCK